MLFVILVLAVAMLVMLPYIIIARKRSKMLGRLTFVARKSGYRVRKLHRFVCFSFNRAPRYDLLFESKTQAFAVKLWSATRKNSTLVIRTNGTVFQRMYIPKELDTAVNEDRTVKYSPKPVSVTKKNFKLRSDKQITNIMLCYPPHGRMILSSPGSQKSIGVGDRVFDKTICSPGYFEQLLIGESTQTSVAEKDSENQNS